MNHQLLCLDAGNWGIKAKTETSEDFFLHGIMELSQQEYRKLLARSTDDESKTEIMVVNNTPYAIGNTAIRNGFTGRRSGASRYERDYYGVMAAAVMFRNFDRNMRKMLVYGSHAPRDIDYRQDMTASVVGEWEVQFRETVRKFTVVDARQVDEPVAGLFNLKLTNDGNANKRSAMTAPKVKDDIILQLVVDLGGLTCDFAIVENGIVDYLSTNSFDIGVLGAVERFQNDVRATHRSKIKRGARNFDARIINRAIRTGILDAGGIGRLDVSTEATHALNELLSEIEAQLDRYEAMTMHDIILTGGGASVIYERLKIRYPHPNIILAGEIETMHMANVNGAMKALKLLRNRGVIS